LGCAKQTARQIIGVLVPTLVHRLALRVERGGRFFVSCIHYIEALETVMCGFEQLTIMQNIQVYCLADMETSSM